MQNYIVNRLRIDARRTLDMADNERLIPHQGVKGRFRELLLDNLLLPWLPPYVSCGTGVIIDRNAAVRSHNQDDIVIYDTSLVPPVMASGNHAPDGVFLFNSVIFRIEVKSTLDRSGIESFVDASTELSELRFQVPTGSTKPPLMGALNTLFAFDSDLESEPDAHPDKDLTRVTEVMERRGIAANSGIVSSVCIPGRGFWKIGYARGAVMRWQKLGSRDALDHMAWWTAVLSNSCYQQHALRQGRDPKSGVEGGIGLFIPDDADTWGWV